MEPAVRSALAVASDHGVRCTDPVVLKDGSNIVVGLRPAPVVVRIAATTALVRPGVAAWFARELAVVEYLVSRGFPVVEPSRELPAGPHEVDGVTMSFWTHVDHDRDAVPTPGEFAGSLAELHAELRDYPGELPDRGPLDDVTWCAGLLTGDHVATILAERDRLAALPGGPVQPLHGDAHPGNVLVTDRGLVWNDFEDTWRGPIHWDLAVMAGTSRLDGKAALVSYPGEPDPVLVERCREIRALQGVCWMLAAAVRQPHRRVEAEVALARWLRNVVRHTV